MMDAIFQELFRRLADWIEELAAEASDNGLLFGLRGLPDYLHMNSSE
jgi:hypothetical protein